MSATEAFEAIAVRFDCSTILEELDLSDAVRVSRELAIERVGLKGGQRFRRPWELILVKREFLRYLTTVRKEEIERVLPELTPELRERLNQELRENLKPSPGVPSGRWFDPEQWSFRLGEDDPDALRDLRLLAFVRGMDAQERGLERGGLGSLKEVAIRVVKEQAAARRDKAHSAGNRERRRQSLMAGRTNPMGEHDNEASIGD